MPLFYNGQAVKSIKVVSEGKVKLKATYRDYPLKHEGHYHVVEDGRVEVKEFQVDKKGKRPKSIGTFSFDDIVVEFFV